jgi:hypothetical protein
LAGCAIAASGVKPTETLFPLVAMLAVPAVAGGLAGGLFGALNAAEAASKVVNPTSEA